MKKILLMIISVIMMNASILEEERVLSFNKEITSFYKNYKIEKTYVKYMFDKMKNENKSFFKQHDKKIDEYITKNSIELNSKEKKGHLFNNQLYYIDFKNKKLYNQNLKEFLNTNMFNKQHVIKYDKIFHQLTVFFTEDNKRKYPIIVNLPKNINKLTFTDVELIFSRILRKIKKN